MSSPKHDFTWLRWYNSAPDDHGRCSKIASAGIGSYAAIPYGSVRDGQLHANGKPPHPDHGQWQWGIALSQSSRTLVIDVDDYEAYKVSDLELELEPQHATSYRISDSGIKLHFVVVVPEELADPWPKQGSTAWGDVKSNGFSYVTGVHYTGSEYLATGNDVIVAGEALMQAILAEPRAVAGGQASGGSAGAWSEEGYAYPDGQKWARGVADVASMVNAGMLDSEITALMTAILLRSDGYAGAGEEVAGWIESARRKYGVAEGESWAELQDRELDDYFARWLGADAWEARKATLSAELQYVQDPITYITRQEGAPGSAVPHVPDLSGVPLSALLNPGGVPVEPAGTTDAYLAGMVLDERDGIIRYAADAGCWVMNKGHYWKEWGTKSEAREKARAIARAWGRNLISQDQAEAEKESALDNARAEWQHRYDTGQLTHDEITDPPDFDKLSDEAEEEHADRIKRLAKNAHRLTDNGGLSAIASMMVTEVQDDAHRLCVTIADLDAEPDVLWAGGVPWSLVSPELSIAAHASPVHLKNCAVAPVAGPHPLWDEATAALWPDPEVCQWALREIAGAALWGETSKHHPVLDGKPDAGKSTVTSVIRDILGGYAADIDPDKLIGGHNTSATEEESAALIGVRMALLDEPPGPDRQSMSRFNRLASGTGEITAAAKYKNRVSAPKRYNMVINQNYRNRMRLDAEGVRQRLVFIPAPGHITVELFERFKAGIRAEYPAILASLIRECALFHAGQRLPVPVGAQVALDSASADGDEFQQWLFTCYEKPCGEVTKADEDRMPQFDQVRKAFALHARELGVRPVTRAQLRDRLAELGVTIREWGGSKSKKHNVVYLHPLPQAQDLITR